jgi:NAD(P)-dependent dehydrogenase (short-subunit alcohol dehydrogenase family)
LVIVATGLLHAQGHGPEKALRDLDPDWLAQVYAVNAIGPALVAKHFLPIMPRTGRAVFAAL